MSVCEVKDSVHFLQVLYRYSSRDVPTSVAYKMPTAGIACILLLSDKQKLLSQLILDLLLNIIAAQNNYAMDGPAADQFAAQSNNPSRTQSNNAAGSQEGHHAGEVTIIDIHAT